MHATGTQTDGAAALADSLASFYGHAMRPSSRLIGEFERLDLSFTQFKALTAAADGEPTVKALAERLGLSLPGASRAVDQLVRRGLLDRREDADDRRCKRLSVTDAGRELVHRARRRPPRARSRPSRRASSPRSASGCSPPSSPSWRTWRPTDDQPAAPERRQPALVDARRDVLRAVHGDARQHRRERRAAVHPARPRRVDRRPRVDGERVHAVVRRAARHRRAPRRHLRPPDGVPHRRRRVRLHAARSSASRRARPGSSSAACCRASARRS